MKIYNKLFVLGLVLFASLGLTNSALAMVPTLSFGTMSNNNVTLTVYGDSNSAVNLYYNNGYGLQNAYLGITNYSGYFSTTINSSTYNITQGSYVYVTVNGQQSTSVIWPNTYYQNNNVVYNNSNNFVVSNLTLPVLGSATMSLGNNATGLFVSNNSNPSVVNTSIGANTNNGCGIYDQYSILTGQPCYLATNNLSYVNNGSVTFTALTIGTATITVCQNNNYYNNYSNTSNNCNTITVNVTGNNIINSGSVLGVSTGGNSCYISRTLRYGMSGTDVSCLQSYLISKGYMYNTSTNSYFDINTRNAVVLFQRDNGLFPDGVVGRNTRNYLY
jgi:hypothetical protein